MFLGTAVNTHVPGGSEANVDIPWGGAEVDVDIPGCQRQMQTFLGSLRQT